MTDPAGGDDHPDHPDAGTTAPTPTTPTAPTPTGRQPILVTIGWWAATLATLIVLDDLTFGPVFWLISVLGSPKLGFLVAFAVYVPVQILLVRAATSDEPHRILAAILGRLELDRRSAHVAQREKQLHARVTSGAMAVLLSFAIGGVLPPLVLWRAGHPTAYVRRLSVLTSTAYALEFALLHGMVPGLI